MICACGHGDLTHPGLEGCVRVDCECPEFRLAGDRRSVMVGDFLRSAADRFVVAEGAYKQIYTKGFRLEDHVLREPLAAEPEPVSIALRWYEELVVWLAVSILLGLTIAAWRLPGV